MTRDAQPPTEPTAERAGDADECYGSDLDTATIDALAAEAAGDADDVATVLAASPLTATRHPRPTAVPDRDENLRAAIEALLDKWEPTHGQWISSGAVRAVLGDPSGALAEHDAKVLRDLALRVPMRFDWTTAEVMAFLRAEADRLAPDTGATT